MSSVFCPLTGLLRLSHCCFLKTTTDDGTFDNAVSLIPSDSGYSTCSAPTSTLSIHYHPQQRWNFTFGIRWFQASSNGKATRSKDPASSVVTKSLQNRTLTTLIV